MGRKIRFAINLIGTGAGEPWVSGKDDETRKDYETCKKGIVDIREWLRSWVIPQDKYIKFMTFGQDGTYYVWARYSSTRGCSDSVSKWIYIPNGVKISGKDILDLERKAKDETRTEVLEKLFATEFPYKPDANAISVTNVNGKEKYAVRYYDTEDQLADIIGEKRFQKYYSDYKVIFLIDRQSGIKVREGAVIDDLTDRTMEERIVVSRPYTAKRNGFDDIDCKIKACENKQCCTFVSNKPYTWSKRITKDCFEVDDAQNNIDGIVKIPSEELDIYINGHLIKEEGVTLTEKQGEDCTIEVKDKKKAPRYELFKKEHAYIFLTERKKIPIHLEKKSNSYAYRIQLSNKEVVKLAINSKKDDFNEKAPFCGYVVDTDPFSMRSKEKMLVLNSFYLLKLIMIGFGIGVVVASIIFFTLFYSGMADNTATSPEVANKDSVVTAPVEVDNYSLEAAIRYLDNNKKWNRDSMERYDDLKGLFDAMNEFRLSTVIDSYCQLSTSTKYATLVETAKKNISNGWNPKTGEHNPQYNNANDIIINFTNYINWIDRDREIPKFTDTEKPDTKKTDKEKNNKVKLDTEKTDKGKTNTKKILGQG